MKVTRHFTVVFPRFLLARGALIVVVILVCLSFFEQPVYGDPGRLENRYDQLSDSTAGATAINNFGFEIADTGPNLGSIEFQFCQESPIVGFPCSTPTGFDASAATLTSQTGNTGFTIASATSNVIILTRPAAPAAAGANNYVLSGIVNPSAEATYYLRMLIYPTTDASGTETDYGGVALATTEGVPVSSVVPPFLEMCVGLTITNNDCSTATGNYINFGFFSPNSTSSATSQFAVGTNAVSGYSVTTQGLTLTSGNNVIPALTSPTPALSGANQFGINLRANTAPSVGEDPQGSGFAVAASNYAIPNRYLYNEGDTIVSSPLNTNYQTFTVSYIANVSADQSPGVYVTTLTFICLANF